MAAPLRHRDTDQQPRPTPQIPQLFSGRPHPGMNAEPTINTCRPSRRMRATDAPSNFASRVSRTLHSHPKSHAFSVSDGHQNGHQNGHQTPWNGLQIIVTELTCIVSETMHIFPRKCSANLIANSSFGAATEWQPGTARKPKSGNWLHSLML